jgi:hypothetical protein
VTQTRPALHVATGHELDNVRWLAWFRTAHPEITVTPPDAGSVNWRASRAGMKIASDLCLGGLRDKLSWYLAREDST